MGTKRASWLLLPETREVVVITKDGEAPFGDADRLAARPELPGLEPEVSRFFAQLDRASPR